MRYCTEYTFFLLLHASGKMAVARQGGWATHGVAERMKIETKELDESMHGADGVAGDVRGAMCEAVGGRVPHSLCAVSALCTNGAKP